MLLCPATARMRAEPRPPMRLGTEPFARKPTRPPIARRAAYGNVKQKSYICATHDHLEDKERCIHERRLGL